jgi:hypothetical protein
MDSLDSFGYYVHRVYQGSVRQYPKFRAESDAQEIHDILKQGEANKGKYDSSALFKILCNRTNDERQQIKRSYKTTYQQEMTDELKKAFKGFEETVFIAILSLPEDYDAQELYGAMKGLGTTESTLIEILCSRSNNDIRNIKMAYRHLYGKELEEMIKGDTSGDFRGLLLALCKADRDESDGLNEGKAKTDAEVLYKAGEKKWGTDEATFYKILGGQNFRQLQHVFKEYKALTSHEIEIAIKKEFSGHAFDALIALVKVVKNRPAYFAEKIHAAAKKHNYKDLLRVVTSRCEKDMVEIKEEFQRLYGTQMETFINEIKDKKAETTKEVLVPLIIGSQF